MLLRNYHTLEVLDYTLDYGIELATICKLKEREERLYTLWTLYFTSPFVSGERKSWDQFYEESTQPKTISPVTKGGQLGKITGTDLAQANKRRS